MIRDPRVFTVGPHRGERNDERNGMVDIGLEYQGMKNRPTDIMHFTPEEAKQLAARLLVAAYQAEGVRL